MSKILYTLTDEAPFLATQSLLPIVEAYTATAGIVVETRDISLSGRILSLFPNCWRRAEGQRRPGRAGPAGDHPGRQHHQAAEHLRLGAAAEGGHQGTAGPGLSAAGLPGNPADDQQRDYKARYDKVKGSAVNPVLREGNPTAAHRCR
jgi:isocitrate dehydrogenase